jgi:hypothetical protein
MSFPLPLAALSLCRMVTGCQKAGEQRGVKFSACIDDEFPTLKLLQRAGSLVRSQT